MKQLNYDELKKLQDEKQEKERRQDNKQHAAKIDQGLRSVDSQTGPARAIWELCQNARDLAEDCHIRIELTDTTFNFSHNGKPFDMDSLSSLIKQVSGQFKESDETVGQYGTGFLTTHFYGMKFKLYGSYQIGENMFIDLDGFEIDRAHDNIDELINKITDQLHQTDELLKIPYSSERQEWTTFSYDLPTHHKDGAVNGLNAAIKQMPYVMLFNDRITECQIDDNINNLHIAFKKSRRPDNHDLKVMRIDIVRNGESLPMDIYYLESANGDERIVLPLETPTMTRNLDGISKLFMHFPLLGTEEFGFNFVFHSRNFKPEEKRNGLFLPDGNDNNEKEANINIKILEKMKSLVFDWLKGHVSIIKNTKILARLCFNPNKYENTYKADYIKSLEKEWGSYFATLPMIPTREGLMSVADSKLYLFNDEIVSCLDSDNYSIYLHTVWNYAQLNNEYVLPIETESLEWSKIVRKWGDINVDPFIGVATIANNVKEQSEELHGFLMFLKACKYEYLFTSSALIPNREGVLRKANELRDAQAITSDLYKIARPLIELDTDRFVDEAYTDIYEFDNYDRTDLRDDIKQAIDDFRDEITTDDRINGIMNNETIHGIIDCCSAFSTLNGNSVRNRLMPIISKYQGTTYDETFIPKINDDEADIFDNAFRFLVEYTMFCLSCEDVEWVKDHLNTLSVFLSEVSSVGTFKKQAGIYSIYPNYYYTLCLAEDLRKNAVERDKCDDLLRLYEIEFGEDLRDSLVHQEFEDYWDFDELRVEDICKEIEDQLAEDDYSSKMTIEIIEKIDSDEEGWGKLFKNIRDNKQNIFFKNAVSGTKKNDVYRLMKNDEETLSALADLAEKPNMTEILYRAQQLIEQDRIEKANFELMYSIGKHIEDIIRSKLSDELSDKIQVTMRDASINLEVDDIQNGQDIIIRHNGQDVFYIEVKAKRNFGNPAFMSKNQIRMACKNANKYALCCVDLSSANCQDIENPTIDEILPYTHFKNDIGKLLSPLVSPVLKADEDLEDRQIKLNGDYTASIPKSLFTTGVSIDEIITDIIEKIQNL